MVRGEGCYLWDDQGTRRLDMSSGMSSTAVIGQGREDIAEAMLAQARRLAFVHSARLTNDRQEELAGRLARLGPDGVDRVMFTSGGSEANELSLRIARQYHLARGDSRRWKFVTLDQSYHGATVGAMSMTGRADLRADYEPYMLGFPKVPPPVAFRGPYGGLDDAELVDRATQALVDAIEAADASTVAAFIAEPISASTGMAVPPPGYWPRVREICDEYGILFVADEIITGLGRTGSFLALDHEGVTADVTNLAKGLGAGYVPFGATLIKTEVAETIGEGKRRMAEVHTYSGSPLSCAIGLAVLDVVEREQLVDAARVRGEYLAGLLSTYLGDLPNVGDIRGRGLLRAVEYVASRETRESLPSGANLSGRLWTAMWNRGVVMSTVRFNSPLIADCTHLVPPLIATESELDEGVSALREAIIECMQQTRGDG
jgi:adenosylmethionine-8-amino-7-oxononanoate aminotransferase